MRWQTRQEIIGQGYFIIAFDREGCTERWHGTQISACLSHSQSMCEEHEAESQQLYFGGSPKKSIHIRRSGGGARRGWSH